MYFFFSHSIRIAISHIRVSINSAVSANLLQIIAMVECISLLMANLHQTRVLHCGYTIPVVALFVVPNECWKLFV